MSKPNSALCHTLHRLAVYNFRFHPQILCTYTTNIFHSHKKQKIGLKWASQLITQIWKLICWQWLHRSKLKNAGESLDYNIK